MATPKQIRANKLNAKKSKGPITENGKKVVSKNALKHGLLSKESLLPWESNEEFSNLRISLIDSLQPEGELELLLVDRLTALVWRLRRIGRIESSLYVCRRYVLQREITNSIMSEYLQRVLENSNLDGISVEDLLAESKITEAVSNKLISSGHLAYSDLPELGLIFKDESNTFTVLYRYETGIEKSLFKTLHELQRIQSVRKGNIVPPPIAIDVHSDLDNL